MEPFDLEKALAGEPVVTRSGKPVKIAGYNPDGQVSYEIIGWVNGMMESWCINGKVYEHGLTDGHDLFMAPKECKEWIVRTPVLVDLEIDGNNISMRLFGPYSNYETAKETAESLKGTIHEITIHE